MAEFLERKNRGDPAIDPGVAAGFAAMGEPVPIRRRQAAFEHCKNMGLKTLPSWIVIQRMSEALARDDPYSAMEAGMRHLDLCGTYRLIAVLLTAE